jgi:ABC-type multidrug transport system ATPase subunit
MPTPASPIEAPPFVPLADSPVLVGRSDEAILRLPHPSVSRRHATLRPADGGLVVEDHDSRFGTYVNGVRVRRATAQPEDLLRFGSAITYRVVEGGLKLDFVAGGVALAASGLTIAVDPAPGQADSLRIHVSFVIRPDTFVGLLGPSGVGKTTLLRCLVGSLAPSRGRLVFDDRHDAFGEAVDYQALLGYVPQRDVVYETLTARENLTFAARLRLSGEEGVAEAVADSLDQVGLAKDTHDRPAANLSGGERKRLSVAIELLRRPRLLLLDEPTSGLDPASEAHLMEQLRLVARRGTTVVCATHLMDNLRLLDEAIVLGKIAGVARLAYVGPPDDLLPRFGLRGFADLYEALDLGRFEPVVAAPDDGAGGPEAGPLPDLRRGVSPPAPATIATARQVGIDRIAAGRTVGTDTEQLRVVARRAGLLTVRDRGLALALLVQPVVLGLLVALTQYHVAEGEVSKITFFAVVVAIWLGLNQAARDLVRERRPYVRDRLAGLRPGAYLGAKAAVHAVVGVTQVLILLAVLRVGCGLVLEPNAMKDLLRMSTPWLAAVLMLCHAGGVGLGLLASTLAQTEEAAVAALPLLILPQLLISAVATGTQHESYTTPRPFRPLVVCADHARETLWGSRPAVSPSQGLTPDDSPPAAAALVDLLSLFCLSRPATLILDPPNVAPFGRWTWIGDLCHLLILVLGTWLLVFRVFDRAERGWPRLVGL